MTTVREKINAIPKLGKDTVCEFASSFGAVPWSELSELDADHADRLLVRKFNTLLRELIQSKHSDIFLDELLSKLGGVRFCNSKSSFSMSLLLLTSVSAILAKNSSWSDDLLSKAAEKQAKREVNRHHDSGAVKDIYYWIACAQIEFGQARPGTGNVYLKKGQSWFLENELKEGYLINDYRGAFNFFQSSEVRAVEMLAERHLDFNLLSIGVGNKDLLVFAAVDGSYFKRFSEEVVTSFCSHSSRALHIHLSVVNQEELSDIRDLIDGHIRKPQVGISYSLTGSRKDSAYYTMVRYLFSLTIFRIYQRNILITDFDISFNGEPGEAVLNYDLSEVTVAIFRKKQLAACLPWFKYGCHYVYIKDDEFGNSFLRKLCLMSQYWLDKVGPIRYNIDQNIIFSVERFMSETHAQFKSVEAFPTFVSVDKSKFP